MTALVVMPAYNEEASLAATLKELASGVPSVDVLMVEVPTPMRPRAAGQASTRRLAFLRADQPETVDG